LTAERSRVRGRGISSTIARRTYETRIAGSQSQQRRRLERTTLISMVMSLISILGMLRLCRLRPAGPQCPYPLRRVFEGEAVPYGSLTTSAPFPGCSSTRASRWGGYRFTGHGLGGTLRVWELELFSWRSSPPRASQIVEGGDDKNPFSPFRLIRASIARKKDRCLPDAVLLRWAIWRGDSKKPLRSTLLT
jgi:hypothetical protein